MIRHVAVLTRIARGGAMPTYEFLCESCAKNFTVTLTIAERADAKVRCRSCGSEKVTPRLTAFTAKTSRKS